jgi:protein TonB
MSGAKHFYKRKLLAALVTAVLGVGTMPATGEDLLQVTEAQALKAVISKTEPVYPPMAKQMGVSGKVSVKAFVDTSGKVEKVEVVSGNVMLGKACVTAVEKWKFNPFEADGKATGAAAHLEFSFH